MVLADRPTTSRWTPQAGRTLLLGQADPRRQEPRPTLRPQEHSRRGQLHSEPDLGSAFDPTRTVARAGNQNSTPGLHSPRPASEAPSRALAQCHEHDRAVGGATTIALTLMRARGMRMATATTRSSMFRLAWLL